jgi:hypothetical protein
MLFDPPIDLRGDGADDHATVALEDALTCSGGQSPIRIGEQLDHGKLQFRRGGLDGLLVFGPEPRGLGQRGAGWSAVDEDRGHGVWFWLDWVSHRKSLLESKEPRKGSRWANALMMVVWDE